MKFKKLSLLGFKSFANKTNIEFGEGITAIVGPNGCGKSNVADAVRWVLGEQSPKLLRGSNMQDVIFVGTEKRSALSYAEVSLTFDNTGRSLFPSYEYEEVVISRKLFRSGESEYYRNGSRCLLRDISEMLRDAGFATEGYTVIGQNKAMEIVNAKPEDRRLIFEEAAGITKYKYRKTAAENKNKRTRDNLSRIDDAMAIDLSRLEPLTKQAERARLALDLKEKIKFHDINLYINRYETAAETKDALSAVITDLEAQITAKQAEYDAAYAEYNNAMDELRNIDSRIEGYRDELMNLVIDREKTAGQIGMASQQLEHLKSQGAFLASNKTELLNSLSSLQEHLTDCVNERDRLSAEYAGVRDEFDSLNREYSELAAKVGEEERRIEAARAAYMAAMTRRLEVSKSVGELTAELSNAQSRAETLRDMIAATEIKLDEGGAELADRAETLQRYARERGELVAEQRSKTDENRVCEQRLKETSVSLIKMREEYSSALSRKKMTEDLIRGMRGIAEPVRKLINDAKTDVRVNDALKGVVGKIMTIREGFDVAIEAALGSAVNNIVTEDEEGAKFLIAYLKSHDYGRATFLPLTSCKPRSIDRAYLPLLDREGCFGPAVGVLTFDKYFARTVESLLGNTVIAKDLDVAVEIARECGYAFRIVTLDGDIVTPQGSLSGGSKGQKNINVISLERDLKKVTELAQKCEKDVKDVEREREELSKINEILTERLRALVSDIHTYEVTEASKTAEFGKLKDELSALAARKAEDEHLLAQLTAHIESISADLEAVESADRAEERSEDAGDRDRSAYEKLRAQSEAVRETIAMKNLSIATLEKDLESVRAEIDRLNEEINNVNARISDNEMASLHNNRAIQEYNDRVIEMSKLTSTEGESREAELRSLLDNLAQFKQDLNERIAEGDGKRNTVAAEITEITERKHEQMVLIARVDTNMDELQSRVRVEYDMGYEDCLQFKAENYDPESGELEVGKLRRRFINLGQINYKAIEDSQTLSQEYNERKRQRDDLVQSLADTEQIIKEMSEKMVSGFDSCFEQIRHNFQETFVQLFNGGSADLELLDNEDPLQRGVEIIAQPPSKKLQSISLLSGGEKTLTSVAILFAILKLRPMPFCLLDEIEAALDDANVGRVADMLKQFSKQTQLIAITHRKPTMEQADSLYGVTMEEKGVSTIVSVRLADAVKNASSVVTEE